MTIDKNKVNVINGSVVGVHLGTPMQDATPKKPEDNEVYATERNTVTRVPNSEKTWEKEPTPIGGGNSDVLVLKIYKYVDANDEWVQEVNYTFDEVWEAAKAGKAIIVVMHSNYNYMVASYVYFNNIEGNEEDGEPTLYFGEFGYNKSQGVFGGNG